MRIVLPKLLDTAWQDSLFFLLGPIKGGGDWHIEACTMLAELAPQATVAAPRRWKPDHELAAHFVTSGKQEAFPRQTLWERHYLELAANKAKRGCVIGWLPCESRTMPRDDGQPYGRDSYGEIGEWRGRMMYRPNSRFVLGAEAGFPGLSVIQENWNDALKKEFHICTTLEETIRRAIEISSA